MADEDQSTEKKTALQYMKDNPFITLPLQAYKARRNMLLCAVLCWFQVIFFNLGDDSFKVLGHTLDLNKTYFNITLLIITIYFMAYFTVLAWPTRTEWKLRSTYTYETTVNDEENMTGVTVVTYGGPVVNVGKVLAWPKIANKLRMIEKEVTSITPTPQQEGKYRQETVDKIRLTLQSLEKTTDALVAYDKECFNYQKNLNRSFWIWEFGGPFLFAFAGALLLVGRMIVQHSASSLWADRIMNLCGY